MGAVLYLLFFCSGFSGLIYQVIWIRVFGNVFGNTIYSASLVIAVFMLGLGAGSYLVGAWADRRYAAESRGPTAFLRTYGWFELLIGLLGFSISVLLPHLGELSAMVSSYSRDGDGWYVLSTVTHMAHGAIAVVLLAPITLLMGGTLILLIRHQVGGDLELGGWRIAVLYTVNTAGAALGCFLTDIALVPACGLLATQMVAVAFNVAAGVGALYLARVAMVRLKPDTTKGRKERHGDGRSIRLQPTVRSVRPQPDEISGASAVAWTSVTLALTGFAAMGMEILWFRHFTILLGEFRAVLSLLLTIILVGIAVGSFVGGVMHRGMGRPALWLIVVQGLFIASTLLGLSAADAQRIKEAGVALGGTGATALQELWFNARTILLETGLPALLMGFAFPLGNAVVQRVELLVGRRAGLLYLANTAGAVAGSLAAGFLLLPAFGIQRGATILMMAAALAIVPLYAVARRDPLPAFAPAGSMTIAAATLGFWLWLPPDHVIARAQLLVTDAEHVLTVSEGITEVVAVTDVPGRGRMLLTNGHPMSSTDLLSQRYMRALAHIPLLSLDDPEDVLVMCFGVGNTAHAATLHPSVRRVEVVDLSRHVLAHAPYFSDANRDVLKDPRVAVFVNDGRHHLQMQGSRLYDVITLEPPPVTHAGIGALYSREFYARARTRLKPKGYLTQWLPVGRVPAAATLSMVRAFIDVFPQAVLLSGAHTNLLLVGANDSSIEIDPHRMATALSKAPAVQADLQRLDLGSVREIVGTFVASARTLSHATRETRPATDDRPIQEYGVRSLLKTGEAPPSSIVDLNQVAVWCRGCFADGKPVPLVDGLDTYLQLLALAYQASPGDVQPALSDSIPRSRVIAGSGYLGAVIPESATLHHVLGAALAARGNREAAIAEFREALRLEPDSAATHLYLGRTLAAPEEALPHLRRSVELDPRNGEARYHLATALLETRRYEEAVQEFRAAVELNPDSAEIRNNLGVTLASQGKLNEAIDQFRQALRLQPAFADASRNLARALEKRRRTPAF